MWPLSFCCSSVTALSYNIALSYYSQKNYAQALKYIGEIIERGIREHPGENTSQWNCHHLTCVD